MTSPPPKHSQMTEATAIDHCISIKNFHQPLYKLRLNGKVSKFNNEMNWDESECTKMDPGESQWITINHLKNDFLQKRKRIILSRGVQLSSLGKGKMEGTIIAKIKMLHFLFNYNPFSLFHNWTSLRNVSSCRHCIYLGRIPVPRHCFPRLPNFQRETDISI